MALNEAFRTHTAAVSRPTRTADGGGGWTLGYAPVGSIVGSLQPSSSAEDQVGGDSRGTERARVRWWFYAEPDADAARDDQLVVGGRTFTVIAVESWGGASDELAHLRLPLEEIQQGG